MSSRLQSGGIVEIREVVHRQILPNRPSSSTTTYISSALVPHGSSMDSALSRTINMSMEDRNGRKGADPRSFRHLHQWPQRGDGGSEGGRGEFVTTDEPTVLAEPPFNAIVVKDGQNNGDLADSASTNQSDRSKMFCEVDNLPDQLITAKEDPRWRRW